MEWQSESMSCSMGSKAFPSLLYGYTCTVFTDHEALKSLLNTPHSSEKLAHWRLVFRVLDLHIKYWHGKNASAENANADYLLRNPHDFLEDGVLVAALLQQEEQSAKDGEECLQ